MLQSLENLSCKEADLSLQMGVLRGAICQVRWGIYAQYSPIKSQQEGRTQPVINSESEEGHFILCLEASFEISGKS